MPPAEPVSGSRLLVADVGGTNARFAIADLETLALADIEEFQCTRHSSLVEAMRAYLDRLDDPPAEAAIAVAGPVVDDRVSLTNCLVLHQGRALQPDRSQLRAGAE